MRGLKFRVWCPRKKCFLIQAMTPYELMVDSSNDLELLNLLHDEVTWQQYIGLKDKNGKDVFEGDIVRRKAYNGYVSSVVKFEKGAFIVGYHSGSSTGRRPMLIQKNVEVIGNIFEK